MVTANHHVFGEALLLTCYAGCTLLRGALQGGLTSQSPAGQGTHGAAPHGTAHTADAWLSACAPG